MEETTINYDLAFSEILNYLRSGEQTGWPIVHRLREVSGIRLEHDALIYLILKKMEQKKLISSYWKFNGDRPKKFYRIRNIK